MNSSAWMPAAGEGTQHWTGVDADAGHLRLDDVGVVLGDGAFETIRVVDGRPASLSAHLDRFAQSARAIELVIGDTAFWAGGALQAAAEHGTAGETFLRLVATRASATDSTRWIVAGPTPDHAAARTTGITVVLLDRGVPARRTATTRWLATEAKLTSYGMNRAALRHAHAAGADDAILCSADGLVLEGPTSAVLLRFGDRLVTPGPDLHLLPSITRDEVFAIAPALGLHPTTADVTVEDLTAADGVWLLSSLRLAAPVRAIDGRGRPIDADLTARLNAGLLEVDLAR